MTGGKILDVAIGLSFVYLLLAIIASSINELIAWATDLRAKTLRQGIGTLVNSPAAAALAERLYKSPLIESLKHKKVALSPKADATGKADPSYIPKTLFAKALVSEVLGSSGGSTLDDLRNSAELPAAVRVLLDRGVADWDKAHAAVAEWFDNSMDRLSGEYKRHSQLVLGVVAFFVVLILNADSLRITRGLWTDPKMREALVQGAIDQVGAPGAKSDRSAENRRACEAFCVQHGGMNVFQEWPDGRPYCACNSLAVIDDAAKLKSVTGSTRGGINVALENWTRAADLINGYSLPIGWSLSEFIGLNNSWDYVLWIFIKLIGLAFTVLAVSLGAPFWFDALNKLANIRSAGPSSDTKRPGR